MSCSSCSEAVNVDTRSSRIAACQWLDNLHRQGPETNYGIQSGICIFPVCCAHILRRAIKKVLRSSLLLWRGQRCRPPISGGDIWDGRANAKALQKNHPFWAALAGGKSAAAAAPVDALLFFFNLSTLSYLSAVFSFLPRLCLAAESPRLSLISPEPRGLFGAIEQRGKSRNYHQVRDAYQAAIYFLIWP